MNRYSRAILVFSAAFAVFFMAPAFLSMPFGPYPLMSWGDVFDLFTPVVLLPLYWNLYRLADRPKTKPDTVVPFIILAALWIEGQGMHLAANSIGHLLTGAEGSGAYDLTFFYDETLSHYIWHLGVTGLAGILILRHWHAELPGLGSPWSVSTPAVVLYGFTFSAIILEAKTAPLGIPFLLILIGVILFLGREERRNQPLIAFFFRTSIFSLVLLAGWWLYWGVLLEPSKWLKF